MNLVRGWRARLVAVIAALLVALWGPAKVLAVSNDEQLTNFASEGAGAGQIGSAINGMATDSATGHVFLGDTINHRIDEFTPWGGFVKAIGWDVAPGAVNEQQEVRVRATAGQFKLTFGANTTGDLPFNATGAEVENALNGLPSVGAGGVAVQELNGDPTGTTPFIYIVVFKGGPLVGANVGSITAANGTVPLSGGNPTTNLIARTRAEGGPSTTGLETCTAESQCKAGSGGAGPGQLSELGDIAIAPSGNIYVSSNGNRRVDVFGPGGAFLLMFGGEVNKTTGGNVCTASQIEAGNECGAGVAGSASGQFAAGLNISLGIGPGSAVFAAQGSRIQKFSPTTGVFESEVTVPGETIQNLEVSPTTGDFYVDYQQANLERPTKENVRHLTSAGVEQGSFPVLIPKSVALDSTGNVYAVEQRHAEVNESVFQFSPSGPALSPPSCCTPAVRPGKVEAPTNRFELRAIAFNGSGDLYAAETTSGEGSSVRAYGPAPTAFEAPPAQPPTIVAEFASNVTTQRFDLSARINPHFWNDTRYFVEWGKGTCSAGECVTQPAPPGLLLTSNFVEAPLLTAAIPITSLEPGTTYHYRFVSQSGGGGPVIGPEQSVTTFREGAREASCPNQSLRTGLSSTLPDCRAYEMVSPINKEGGDIRGVLSFNSWSTSLYQSSPDGERISYTSYRPFAGSQSGSIANQYLATRGNTEWSTAPLSAAHGPTFFKVGHALENEFKAFSPDLCTAWLVREAEPLLAPGAAEGFPNAYVRRGCGAATPSYSALTTAVPVGQTPNNYVPEPQGSSEGGSGSLIRVAAKLTPDATVGASQLYLSSEGALHFVCILPDGSPFADSCSAGTGFSGESTFNNNRVSNLDNAISADGSRIYWTAAIGQKEAVGPGQIYLRSNADQPQSAIVSAECTEPSSACTVAVSQAGAAARFLAATSDGARALYLIEDSFSSLNENLYLYDANEGTRTLVAKGVEGVAGTSEDLSRIYFVSDRVIAGTSGATAGEPNLYLFDGESMRFVATLAPRDIGAETPIPSDTDSRPVLHAAQATPDGETLAFISTAKLTGFDNTDSLTGKQDSEVYVYHAAPEMLHCVSCNPTGANPTGREFRLPFGSVVPTAASLPLPLSQFYTPRALSSNGSRVFFNSFDPLTVGDTNGKADVYQWEFPGTGGCTERSPSFSGLNGGCVALISNGKSSSDSEFVDASPDGRDAFFTTDQSLLPQDSGQIDLYDARENGGLPPVPTPGPSCQAEFCQPQQTPPATKSPSSTTPGPGNVKPKPRCPKGKHAGKKHKKKGKAICKGKHQKKKHPTHKGKSNPAHHARTRSVR